MSEVGALKMGSEMFMSEAYTLADKFVRQNLKLQNPRTF